MRTGAINKGVGHGIKKVKKTTSMKVSASRKTTTKSVTKRNGGRFDCQIFSVQASVIRDDSEAPADSQRRFFRSRAAGRRPVVKLINSQSRLKHIRASVNHGGIESSPTTTPSRRSLLPDLSSSPRRSPRKCPPRSEDVPGGGGDAGASSSGLRRSPRKSVSRFLTQSGRSPLTGPTRLILDPPFDGKACRSAVSLSPGTALGGRTPRRQMPVDTNQAEQVMVMESEEDKENESPSQSPKSSKLIRSPRFYSIFYKQERKDGIAAASPSSPSLTASSSDSGVVCKHNKRISRRSDSSSLHQLSIDAGQKRQGVTACATCGVMCSDGDEHDSALHAKHHASLANILQFPGWKKERLVGQFVDGRVLMIVPTDPQYAWKKVTSLLSLIDEELGFSGVGVRDKSRTKVLLFVCDGEVRGCLVAESIDWAYPVHDAKPGDVKPMSCELARQPCVCGISRVWVHSLWRRRKIASKLIDSLRCHFGVAPLSWNDIAFSDPTPEGALFAAAVTANRQYLVYSC